MKIHVTQEILDSGDVNPYDSCECYIAKALAEAGHDGEANEECISVDEKQYHCSVALAHWQLDICNQDEIGRYDPITPITIVFTEGEYVDDMGNHWDGYAEIEGE